MSTVSRTIVLALLLLCLPVTVIGGAIASPADGAAVGGETSTFERVAFQQEAPTADENESNETVRHRNPDGYGEDGNQEELERWLSGQLSGQLESGAAELSEGEYELARQFVDDEYRDRLSQYAEVTGNDERVETFENAQREQEEMTDAVAEYEETKAEYEAAREEGDDERARELARELERLANEIDDSSGEVQENYTAISNDSDADLSDATAEIEAVNDNVQREQDEVREAEFVATELTVESESEDISFVDPMVASGTLRADDGSPVANEEVRFDVGNQTIRTETDASGWFEFEYRPIAVPLSADSVSVEYVPENESAYLGSETSVPVSIDQVEPSLSVESVDPETVAYGDRMAVESDLSVDGESITDVPLDVSIDGVTVGTVESGEGRVGENETVSADVPAGEQELTVALPFEDRALASADAETTITVEETDPDITLSASRTGEREVTVNGTLEVAGDGVEGQSIQLVADGETLETLTTDENGEFSGSFSVPEDTAVGDVQIAAVHDDDGTNLARTEAASMVSFPGADTSLLPTWAWIALGLALVTAAGVGVYRYRNAEEPAPTPTDRDDEPDPTPTAEAETETPDPAMTEALLSRAVEQLSRGDPNDAVQNSYTAVRKTLESRIGAAESLTHWEFYRRYRNRMSSDDRSDEPLRDLTEGYERAAFGRDGVPADEAATIVERARELCGIDESSRTASNDD